MLDALLLSRIGHSSSLLIGASLSIVRLSSPSGVLFVADDRVRLHTHTQAVEYDFGPNLANL